MKKPSEIIREYVKALKVLDNKDPNLYTESGSYYEEAILKFLDELDKQNRL